MRRSGFPGASALPGWLRRGGVGRRPAALLAAGLVLVAAMALGSVLAGVFGEAGSQGGGHWAASQQDPLRTGWDSHEPGLSPRVVSGRGFGQLFSVHVDGAVLGQPVSTGRTLVVVTEQDWVYGLDPVTGAVRWRTSLGKPVRNSVSRCATLGTVSGITSTPVYDARSGRLYVTGEIAGGRAGGAQFLMAALDPRTGAIIWKKPVAGAPANDPRQPFLAAGQLQRPALLLLDGWVYAAFGARCEGTLGYGGFVVGVNTSTQALSMWTTEALTTGGGSVWQGGSGLMSDGRGRIFLATGNGISPAPGRGTAPPGQLAESVVELAVRPGGRLVTRDFFSPADAPVLDTYDLELGSAVPVALPFGTRRYPHLLAMAGKSAELLLLNRDSLGGRETGPGRTDNVVSSTGPFGGGLYGRVAAFAARGADYIYYLGQSDYLRALRLETGPGGRPVLADVARSAATFGVASSPPVVTSDGSAPGSAVVWVVNNTFPNATLEAYDAVPQRAGAVPQLKQIWSASLGLGSHFSTPAVAAGRVYVANQLGQVFGFGAPSRAPLAAVPTDFGAVSAGGSAHAEVTVTAQATVTVSAVRAAGATTPDPFTAGLPRRGAAAVQLPVTLTRGQKLSVPVTFTPAVLGGAAGSLDFTTTEASFPAVGVSLSGTGTRPGLFTSTSSVPFTHTDVGVPGESTVAITNGGTTNVTVASVRLPRPPFRVTGAPEPGTVIRPGATLYLQFFHAPVRPGQASSEFQLAASAGPPITEYLTGTAFPPDASLSVRPARADFGRVAVGRRATRVIYLADPGGQPLIITRTTALRPPFRLASPIAAGQPLGPALGTAGELAIPVEFSPARAGKYAATYRIRFVPLGGGPPRQGEVTITGRAID